jgi:hypothetical protein
MMANFAARQEQMEKAMYHTHYLGRLPQSKTGVPLLLQRFNDYNKFAKDVCTMKSRTHLSTHKGQRG